MSSLTQIEKARGLRRNCHTKCAISGPNSQGVTGSGVALPAAMTRTIRFAFMAAALTIATSCGSSNSTPTSPSNSGGNNTGTPVSIVSGARTLTTTAYNPNPLTIAAGTTVTWTNNDST